MPYTVFAAPAPKPVTSNESAEIDLDFTTAATGLSYRIDIVVRGVGGKVLVSGPVHIGAGAGTDDIRDAIAAALGDGGLEIVPAGGTTLKIASKGDVRLGSITYNTVLANRPAMNLAGPTVRSASGGATMFTNGTRIKP